MTPTPRALELRRVRGNALIPVAAARPLQLVSEIGEAIERNSIAFTVQRRLHLSYFFVRLDEKLASQFIQFWI